MSITIGRYDFEGPLENIHQLENCAGIFVLLKDAQNQLEVIEFGGSESLKSSLSANANVELWSRRRDEEMQLLVHYTPQMRRRSVEEEVRYELEGCC
jgi:hypothetical protein